MEARINQPPPAPVQSTDFAAMSTLKEILVRQPERGGRGTAARDRRGACVGLDEERQQREREREEARDRREREREEERSRREDERARREAADREAQRTLEQYRMLGESSSASRPRRGPEVTGKQNDPAPRPVGVGSNEHPKPVQQAQLMATLFKNFGQGGGSEPTGPS